VQKLWGVQGTITYEKYLGLLAMVGRSNKSITRILRKGLSRGFKGGKRDIYLKQWGGDDQGCGTIHSNFYYELF
jgi:hypothetical protein